MTSFKQKRIIEIAKEKGSISFEQVERIYPHINQRRNSMSSLEILGYLKVDNHGWKYAK